jgi:hypothetical protein
LGGLVILVLIMREFCILLRHALILVRNVVILTPSALVCEFQGW